MSTLTLRNLTAIPLDLVLIERFRPVDTTSRGLLRNLTSFNLSYSSSDSAARPSNAQLVDHAVSFSSHDLSIHIPAFSISNTSLHPPSIPNNAVQEQDRDTIRLTFLASGEKYRLDVPAPKFESQTLQCLAPHPRFRFTGFHVRKPEQSYVAICDSTELNRWMRNLKDETPLSSLSIPGTHNSPTCYKALPSVRCQAVTPREQLENGVRFLDVRVQPESSTSHRLILVHAAFPISFTGTKYLSDLLNDTYSFLEMNPSEAIVMSIKREGAGTSTDQQLARILHDNYTTRGPTARHWYTQPRIPNLGAVRGKIVLFRRFRTEANIVNSSGINAETWQDNTPYDLGKTVCVQDFYKVLETVNIDEKVAYVSDQMRRAAACVTCIPGITTAAVYSSTPQPLYLNFLSASNLWRMGCWPQQIAKKLNPAILEYLVVSHAVEGGHNDDRHNDDRHEKEKVGKRRSVDLGGDGCTGIVVCDWVGGAGDWDLVRCIVAMNCKLIIREMEAT